jgi:branched-chain amino acid transport system permease protein
MPMTVSSLLMQTLSGISLGLNYFIVAAGLVIIFSVLRILNLAHGSIYMFSSYICFWIMSQLMKNAEGSFLVAIIFGPLIVAFLGGVIEWFLLRPMYPRPHIYQFLLTFGLLFVFIDVIRLFWGMSYHIVRKPEFLAGHVQIIGTPFPVYNILMIIVGLLVYLGITLFLSKTKYGVIIRAVTTDREMVSIIGINVFQIYTLTFMLGCWLSGLAGALMAPMAAVNPSMGDFVLIYSFVIVVIGGFGSVSGALLASILVGLVQSFGILILPRMAVLFPFGLMALILIIRPWGLLGKRIKPARL